MVDTARTSVLEIARLIEDHQGEDIRVLDVGPSSGWTDFFLISTVRSTAHLRGLIRTLREYFHQNKIEPLNPFKNAAERGWVLIDCGNIVIHLMDRERRDFYELEKLWFKSELIYSSKSS